jgi:methionyl-tRNA formyltransferase
MNRVAFLGSKALGLACLKKIYALTPESLVGIVTFDDTDDTRTSLREFQAFAKDNQLDLRVAASPRDAEKLVVELVPDLCLVVGWYWLISATTLAKIPGGFVGLHNSLLPRYRGAAPLVWAMLNGDSRSGVTLFSFSAGMDNGPIWGQRAIEIAPHDYIADVLVKVEDAGPALLSDLWSPLLHKRIEPTPQNDSNATFCAVRTPDDGLIDWSWSAERVYNFIRGQSTPYPGAYTFLPSVGKLSIWRAQPLHTRFYGTPGQVAEIRADSVVITCGDHRPLLVQEVSAGVEHKSAPTVLKSLKIRFWPGPTDPSR